tara:strand:+ start:28487 stop:30394 length:1908 start_codon:yes stop_codon:yes gene_type:complete
MKKLSVILFLFVIWNSNSQELEKYKGLYPNAVFVRLQQEIVITIKLNDGNFTITKDIFEEDLYLNESANYNSKRSLSYSSFFDLGKIEASSLSYDGKKYSETKVTDFSKKNDLNDSFYDDSKEVSFIYPKLAKGSKTNLNLTYNIKNPRFLSAFFFGDFYPVINNKITIIADKDITLKFKEFNTEKAQIDFQKKKKGRNNIYTWSNKNTNEYDIEGNAPNYKSILPHIIPIITSYKVKKEEKKLLDGVDGLYEWYYSLVKNINKDEDDQELVDLVKELTQDKTSDLEKVKAIYYWTQQNIKYIAFEYALGGFIPREANDVFKKKYGDCKDNSSILYKMLEIAGLKGNLTWIGTRSIPYTYEEVPTPAVDNHMILSYEENGKNYYLDATGRYIQIDYPSSFIQGKEALVSYGGEYKIKEVPIIPANLNTIVDSTFIKISGRDITGKSSTKLTGYIKNNLFYNLENVRKQSDIKELYNKRFSKGNNKFLIKSFEEINKFSYEEDFFINYNFTIDGYAQNIGSEIFINPHLNKLVSLFKTKKDRKYGIEFDYKKQYSYTNIIEIPEGYTVDYMPESTTFKDDLITVKFSYKVDENKVISQQEVILNFILLSVEQQKIVNTIIEKAEKAYKEIIILKKK